MQIFLFLKSFSLFLTTFFVFFNSVLCILSNFVDVVPLSIQVSAPFYGYVQILYFVTNCNSGICLMIGGCKMTT